MTLARAWARQLYGASAAALLVPGTMIAALVVLAFAGGFGRLGTLGQAFSGPAVPALPGSSPASGGTSAARGLPVPATPTIASAAVPAPAGVAGPSGGGARAGGGGASSTPTHPGGSGGTGVGGTGGGLGSGGGSGSGGGGSGGSPPPVQPPPPPVPRPTLVDSLVGVGTSLTKQVPGPVGAVTTQVLQTVGSTLDHILPSSLNAAGSLTAGLHLP